MGSNLALNLKHNGHDVDWLWCKSKYFKSIRNLADGA